MKLLYGVLIHLAFLIKLINVRNIPVVKHFNHLDKYVCSRSSIVNRPVVAFKYNIKMLCKRIQLIIMKIWHKKLCKKHCVYNGSIHIYTNLLCLIDYEARIEFRIMCNHNSILAEFKKLRQNLLYLRCIHNHLVINVRKCLNSEWNRNLRINKCRESVYYLTIAHLDCTYLYNSVNFRRKSRCLKVEHNICIVKALSSRIRYYLLGIINKISLDSVYYLKIKLLTLLGIRAFEVAHRMECICKCLHNTVVSNCNCLMSPSDCLFDNIRYIRHTIHITHLSMAVQLNSLMKCEVITHLSCIRAFSYAPHIGN